ncbi:MAG: hypothetical protein ACXWUH_12785 [Burkholderiales bacterium]
MSANRSTQPAGGAGFLHELQSFLSFLGSLWGVLAGISVFFPLSNVLLEVIPMRPYGEDGGVYNHIRPALIVALATIVTLFVLLSTFVGRARFRDPRVSRAAHRKAWISLALGVVALLAYLALHQVYLQYAWSEWNWGSDDPRKLLVEVPLTLAFVAFFSLVTRAFVLLGMIEYFRGEGIEQ